MEGGDIMLKFVLFQVASLAVTTAVVTTVATVVHEKVKALVA